MQSLSLEQRQRFSTAEMLPNFLNAALQSMKNFFAVETNQHTHFMPEDMPSPFIYVCLYHQCGKSDPVVRVRRLTISGSDRIGSDQTIYTKKHHYVVIFRQNWIKSDRMKPNLIGFWNFQVNCWRSKARIPFAIGSDWIGSDKIRQDQT
jgi:hypothetical protein